MCSLLCAQLLRPDGSLAFTHASFVSAAHSAWHMRHSSSCSPSTSALWPFFFLFSPTCSGQQGCLHQLQRHGHEAEMRVVHARTSPDQHPAHGLRVKYVPVRATQREPSSTIIPPSNPLTHTRRSPPTLDTLHPYLFGPIRSCWELPSPPTRPPLPPPASAARCHSERAAVPQLVFV